MESPVKETLKEDKAAFEQLYERYKNRVFNTVLSYVQHKDEAEEVTQDVFISVYQSIGQFRQEASISTWIYRIAVTKSLDHLKFRKRKKRFAFLVSIFNKDSGETVIHPPDFVHPGVVLENREKSSILFKAIDTLPENQKTAFILARVEGLSNKEVGEIMDSSVGKIESLLHRARENLRKELGNFYKNYE